MSRSIHTRKPLYILVEGKTERAYIEDFAKCSPRIKIIVVEESSSRPGLLHRALGFSKEYKVDTWIIFDKDDKLEEARTIYNQVATFNQMGIATIHVAYLAPCFEIWPLLHFKQVNVPTSAKEVQKELSRYTKYEHGKDPRVNVSKLEPGYMKAKQMAESWEISLSDTPEYEARLFAGIYRLTEFIKRS